MERQTSPLVVDASVVVKWFVPEKDSSLALKLKDALAGGYSNLIAPDILVYELANALRYRRSLSDDDIRTGIESFFELDLILVSPTTKSISRATSLARALDLTIYDAAYLEVAENLDCQVVTSDRTFHDKVSKVAGANSERIIMIQELLNSTFPS